MKTKKMLKKLILSKVTVANLNINELSHLRGGVEPTTTETIEPITTASCITCQTCGTCAQTCETVGCGCVQPGSVRVCPEQTWEGND